MTARGGLIYGIKLEGVPDLHAQVDEFADGLEIGVISEANVKSCPNIVPMLRDAGVKKAGMEMSSWGGWRTASSYWPLRSELGQHSEWFMRYANGSPVAVGSPALMLIDFTIPAARAWYAAKVKALAQSSGADFIFWDECHRTLGFLPSAADIRLSNQTLDRDTAWLTAMRQLLRACAPIPAMVNGTIHTGDAAVVITGRYIQNSASDLNATIAAATEHLAWHDPDLLCFEHPAQDAKTAVTLAGLVACYGGCAQMNPTHRFDIPVPEFPAPSFSVKVEVAS